MLDIPPFVYSCGPDTQEVLISQCVIQQNKSRKFYLQLVDADSSGKKLGNIVSVPFAIR